MIRTALALTVALAVMWLCSHLAALQLDAYLNRMGV